MENEQMMAVLTELLEDQRKIASAQAETMRIVQQLKIKLEQIETGLQTPGCDTKSGDLKSVQQTLDNGITDIKFAKKWAVILIVAITFLTYLYLFGVHK